MPPQFAGDSKKILKIEASIVIFLAAAIPRIAALLYFPAPEPNYYWVLGESLLKHHTFALDGAPTTYMEPLYPAFLAAARLISGDALWIAMLIQVAVASAGAVLLFQLTESVTGSTRAALIAAGFYVVDPYFVRQSVAFLELPLLLTLLLWALREFFRMRSIRDAVGLGVLLGGVFLVRSSLLPACAAAVILAATRRGWRPAMAAGVTAILVVLPWIVRGYIINGSVMPSRVGENLFVSTSQYAIGVMPQHDVDLLVPFANELVDRELGHLHPTELEGPADDLLLSRALEFARMHPRETLALKLRNLFYLFWPGMLPVEAKSPDTRAVLEGSRVRIIDARERPRMWERVHAATRTVLLFAAAIGLTVRRRRWRDELLLYVLVLSVATVHVVFFPTTRLLAPMTVVLMLYAGYGLDALWNRGYRRIA